jgi:hypothetical protein
MSPVGAGSCRGWSNPRSRPTLIFKCKSQNHLRPEHRPGPASAVPARGRGGPGEGTGDGTIRPPRRRMRMPRRRPSPGRGRPPSPANRAGEGTTSRALRRASSRLKHSRARFIAPHRLRRMPRRPHPARILATLSQSWERVGVATGLRAETFATRGVLPTPARFAGEGSGVGASAVTPLRVVACNLSPVTCRCVRYYERRPPRLS